MGLRAWISRLWAGKPPTQPKQRVRGVYDSAQSDPAHENHWVWTDALNANAANSPAVRKILRERARYEADNNAFCGGLIDKLGTDLIGTCPRLQLRIPGAQRQVARNIELAFQRWARHAKLGQKLRLLDNMAVRDGEGFALLTTNPALPPEGPQLDLRLYECDQVESPYWDVMDPLAFSGGRIDNFGNVNEWHFLKSHPGSNVYLASFLDVDRIPASSVLHWFKAKRAGQLRGVPEILSSLGLYAYLRRWTLATIAAAETAAMLAGIMKTDQPAASEGAVDVSAMQDIELVKGSLLTLPAGWDALQFKPEQPATGYKEFKSEILTEAAFACGAPRNVATGSSAEYNYSSARLDLAALYQRKVRVRRAELRDAVLDKLFLAWLDEAALIPGLIPDGLPLRSLWSWDFYFDGFASLDPLKDAQTDEVNLRNGVTTYAEVFGERGLDWEEQFEQRAEERRRLEGLGLMPAAPAPTPTPATEDPANADAEAVAV